MKNTKKDPIGHLMKADLTMEEYAFSPLKEVKELLLNVNMQQNNLLERNKLLINRIEHLEKKLINLKTLTSDIKNKKGAKKTDSLAKNFTICLLCRKVFMKNRNNKNEETRLCENCKDVVEDFAKKKGDKKK